MASFAAAFLSVPSVVRLNSRLVERNGAGVCSLGIAAAKLVTSSSSSVIRKRLVGTLVGASLGSSAAQAMETETGEVEAAAAEVKSGSPIYDFVVKDIGGNDVEMSQYKGKVLLIVNVASMCGLTTTNYKELTEIYTKYKDQDFEVLAFPCNQFGGQEPGSNEQIKEFACTRFKAEYPIFDKVDVNGPQEAPLWRFLKTQRGGGLLGDSIKWNFAKFLVDKSGNVVERYAPTTPPSKIENDIQTCLSS